MRAAEHLMARQLQGEHIQRVVREPNANGWQGDPWLSVYLNKLMDRWEVVDEQPGSPSAGKVVASARADAGLPDLEQLTVWLRDHDVRNPQHVTFESVGEHNKKVYAEKDKRAVEALADKMEKVVWGAAKDVGHLY